MTDGRNENDRRTAPRYGCPGDAEIVVPGRGLHYHGKIGNLSAGGCFIEAQCGLERGTRVEVWMCAQGQPLRVAASLLVRRTTGVGLRFEGVTERKLAQIQILIGELAEEERRTHSGVTGSPPSEISDGQPEILSRHFHDEPVVERRGWLRRWLVWMTSWRRREVNPP